MKKQVQLGLVAEGKSGDSVVLHVPTLVQELGPVKSSTLRVARRISNTLHAGYAVGDYEELQAARLVLLRVPDIAVPRIVDELCASDLVFRDMTFVLCESWLGSDSMERLRALGSAVATAMSLPSAQQEWFAIEGQTSAVRQTRRFLERNEICALEIRPGSKPLVLAAELFATVLPLPLFHGAQQALRASGVSGNQVSAVLAQMLQKMFTDFSKGARVNWGGPLNECSPERAAAYLKVLETSQPEIANEFQEQLEWARRRMPKARRADCRLPSRDAEPELAVGTRA